MITGFIGAGRTGCSLGKYLSEAGMPPAGYYDLSEEAAKSAAEFTGSKHFFHISDLVDACGLIFITTPDGLIREAWETIKGSLDHNCKIEGKILCHCSGALTSDAFSGIKRAHAYGCSLHPMLPFSSRLSSYKLLKQAFFTIEGDPKAVQAVSELFTDLGNTVCPIEKSCKPKYHAAASILSNQVTAVIDTGYRLLEECGFSREDARRATKTLTLSNLDAIIQNDCAQALTGPIERGDIQTVQKHLSCLSPEDQSMYRILGLKLLRIAQEKNPGKDYKKLQNLFMDNPSQTENP